MILISINILLVDMYRSYKVCMFTWQKRQVLIILHGATRVIILYDPKFWRDKTLANKLTTNIGG